MCMYESLTMYVRVALNYGPDSLSWVAGLVSAASIVDAMNAESRYMTFGNLHCEMYNLLFGTR